jgi:CRP-like cAMP-binding protein
MSINTEMTNVTESTEEINLEQNYLLKALPKESRDRLASNISLVKLRLGDVLYESGSKMTHVVFPTNAIVSLLYVMENGNSAEISVVGHEGVVGVSIFMGSESTVSRAVVQSAGWGYKIDATTILEEFRRHSELMTILLRYTLSLITQMSQTAVCNRHHTIDQQLSRWLLLSLDRLSNEKVVMTQELIANMLGVRREGVTEAAGKLQFLNIISYRRGTITVLDRARLEEQSCECYKVVKKETDRLMEILLNPSKGL